MSISKWSHVFGLSLCLTFCFIQCNKTSSDPDLGRKDEQIFTILYTSDEHGWIEESETSDGAAKLSGLWKEQFSIRDSSILILSGGDNWTGPAIGTWSKGEAVVDVMNVMGYQASAIGNHEFDFDMDNLEDRIGQATFTYISANIRQKSDDSIPKWIQPYIIHTFGELSIGIIGLTTTSTPVTAFPKYVEDLEFTPYIDAVEKILPDLKQKETDMNILLAHVPASEMQIFARELSNLNIPLVLCAHRHQNQHITGEDIDFVETGPYLQNYARIELVYHAILDSVINIFVSIEENQNGTEDSRVAQTVSFWQDCVNAELDEVIGYTEESLNADDPAVGNMITDAWIGTISNTDIAFINLGGIRQGIPEGDINKKTIWGVLPFENHLIELTLTGVQVETILEDQGESLTWAGLFKQDNNLHAGDMAI